MVMVSINRDPSASHGTATMSMSVGVPSSRQQQMLDSLFRDIDTREHQIHTLSEEQRRPTTCGTKLNMLSRVRKMKDETDSPIHPIHLPSHLSCNNSRPGDTQRVENDPITQSCTGERADTLATCP